MKRKLTPAEVQQSIVCDEKFTSTWKKLQTEIYPTKGGTPEDSILGNYGQFESNCLAFSPQLSYKKKREKLFRKHFHPDKLNKRVKIKYYKKCLSFAKNEIKFKAKLPPLSKLQSIERNSEYLEDDYGYFTEMQRFKMPPPNFMNKNRKTWEIVHHIQKNSSFPFVLGGGAAASLWLDSNEKYTDIDLFTIIPLTDMDMWVLSMELELKWLLYGDYCPNILREHFMSENVSSLKCYNGNVQLSKIVVNYGTKIHVAVLFRINNLKDGASIDIIALVDDKPAWKIGKEQKTKGVFLPVTGGCYLQEPVKYNKTGAGYKFSLDPTHLGIKQNRLPMVDFSTPLLSKTLKNPFCLLARVLEFFDFEHCKFGGIFLNSDKLLLVFLGQKPCVVLSKEEENKIISRDIPDHLKNANEGLNLDFSEIDCCLPFDNLGSESRNQLDVEIKKTIDRLKKYNRKLSFIDKDMIKRVSCLPINLFLSFMRENKKI
jgi:hypothetical protein